MKELQKAITQNTREHAPLQTHATLLQKEQKKLSLNEEAKWMQYFNEQKEKVQSLQAEIDKTDKEIDQMVYKLYDLTEDEIAIIEKTTT